ncbi:sugar ABC transporter permease [Herbiconiux sp. CPCC 205763]|uniref:Sugar ABC transporter permease n=1 Tax=Herbiconiux aconitum TaxID=2970913 RepID=A0ABT2GN81_9MICO|nr:sugar ABC transporter permease [Herbiconiux aconitum]MCS5717684.1 sugar ABC transporter permease [Herbiconiux aconitum]
MAADNLQPPARPICDTERRSIQMATTTMPRVSRQSSAPREKPRRSLRGRVSPITTLLLTLPYTVFLAVFGVIPVIMAILYSFGFFGSRTGVGLDSWNRAIQNVSFLPAVINVASFLVIFLPLLLVGATVLALLIDSRRDRSGSVARFTYYLPGVVVGAPLVVLWIFMLAPQLSPFGPLLNAAGAHDLGDVLTTDRFPLIFAIMALYSSVGGWIVVLGGSLAAIDKEILEAARIDGANAWHTAIRIKLPQIQKYIAFIGVISFAGAAQLVVEPTLLAKASPGSLSSTWSLNQLAFYFAFKQNDPWVASVYALMLILLGVAAALFLIFGLRSYSEETAR